MRIEHTAAKLPLIQSPEVGRSTSHEQLTHNSRRSEHINLLHTQGSSSPTTKSTVDDASVLRTFKPTAVKNVATPEKRNMETILVGIPAYNAESTIAKVIVHAKAFADIIIVADDGSTDDTGAIAENLGARVVRHARNRGKGEAIRTVFVEARQLKADALVTLDADGQHDPHDIPVLVRPILDGTADVIVGSRESIEAPRLRRTGVKVLNLATSVRDIDGATVDAQSGFRAYSKRAIDQLDFSEPGMGAEALALKSASVLGLRIKQIPINIKYLGGTDHSLNPISHFGDVLLAIIKAVILKRPVRSLGIPGLVLVIVGVYWWIRILDIYNTTTQFAIGNALVASVVLLAGFFMAISAMVLIAIILAIQERR
jgi:glycosyltransferase involved in cell wall biosynthesis